MQSQHTPLREHGEYEQLHWDRLDSFLHVIGPPVNNAYSITILPGNRFSNQKDQCYCWVTAFLPMLTTFLQTRTQNWDFGWSRLLNKNVFELTKKSCIFKET